MIRERGGFKTSLADVLAATGLPHDARIALAHRILSEVETGQLTPDSTRSLIGEITPHLADALNDLVGRPVRRVLLTPLPGYAAGLVDALLSIGMTVTLADNYKAGTEVNGLICLTLDEALVADRAYDACLLGTIDHAVGQIFRDRLPPERTVALGDLALWHDGTGTDECDTFASALRASRKPLVLAAAYIDTTLVPTLEALAGQGYDVFTITRTALPPGTDHMRTHPSALAFGHHLVTGFAGMVRVLDGLAAPCVVHHAHFLTHRGDLRWSAPSLSYGTALMRLLNGPRIALLYDVVMTATRGFEAEETAFALYRQYLGTADGIVVGSTAAGALAEQLPSNTKILSFLRYSNDVSARSSASPGPLRIAAISHFLGERQDPSRETTNLLASILEHDVELHYYVASPEAARFKDGLPEPTRSRFHLHEPILDQRRLVDTLSSYDAGWFVIDCTPFDRMANQVQSDMAKALFGSFSAHTLGTAVLLYVAAGLPIFVNPTNSCTIEVSAEGVAIPVTPESAAQFSDLIARLDWPALRRRAFEHRTQVTINAQIGRLTAWLEQVARN